MRREARSLTLYSVCHLTVDFACAFLMFGFVSGSRDALFLMLLYNFFAFAGQLPLGAFADSLDRNSAVAASGCVLIAISCALTPFPTIMAVAAGIGNAAFHVGGGVDVLNSYDGAGPLGIYVAPGAIGLYLGRLAGKSGLFSPLYAAVVMLAAASVIIFLCGNVKSGLRSANAPFKLPRLNSASLAALILLFTVICIRSHVGLIMTFPWKSGGYIFAAVLASALGKAAGGFLYDRFGAALSSVLSLGLCAPLLLLSDNAACGLAALLLFNMTMPLTMRLTADLLPNARGFAFGLTTFALFIGFAAVYAGFDEGSKTLYIAGAVLSLLILLAVVCFVDVNLLSVSRHKREKKC